MDRFNVVYADPPWSYSNKKTGENMTSGALQKYPTMTVEEIKAMPIKSLCQTKAVLFIWVTVPLLPYGLDVMDAWGFSYKTMLTWRKVMGLGMGFWFRGQTEHLLLGVRGRVKAFRQQKPNFYQCRVGQHSQKPHHFRHLIDEAVKVSFETPNKLELFARERDGGLFNDYEYDGWHVYGNQIKNSITL